MPLVGFEAVGWLLRTPLTNPVLHRCVVVGDSTQPQAGCMVCDFLPQDPTSPQTAARLLAGQKAPGDLRARRLPRFLNDRNLIRTQLVGALHPSRSMDSLMEDVDAFNRQWDTQLHLLDNNCVHYADALLEQLMNVPREQPHTGAAGHKSSSASSQQELLDVAG